ncbi:MAG: hypothetical protein AUJ88_07315 [Gallionellaceae bacterium CG1_02_56_997]|nr:MAG: hypothetical protein AUJ88_07315 [Gallionellaceae bacterium CG1_02_56_997]
MCFVHWKDEEAAIAQQSLDGAMGCNAQHSLLLSFQARLVVLLFLLLQHHFSACCRVMMPRMYSLKASALGLQFSFAAAWRSSLSMLARSIPN